MKKIVKTLKMWLAAAALAMGFSGNANAACCYVPMEIVAAAITASASAITGAIGASTTALSTVVTNATMLPTSPLIMEIQKAGATNVAQTKTLMEAQAALTKAQTDALHNQTQRVAIESLKAQSINNSRVNGCSALDTVVSRRMGGGAGAAAGGSAAANQKLLERMTNSTSPQAAVKEVMDSRAASYGENAGEYRNADISAGAFFNGANTVNKTSLTFDAKQKKAAEDFARNVVSPIPEPRLDKDTEKTPQGQAYMTMHSSMAGKKSVVAKFFTDHIASRDPEVMGATAESKKLAQSTQFAAMATGYKPATLFTVGGALLSTISYAQTLELEANRRYMGPDWQDRVNATDNQALLLKELAKMQAFQLHLQYLQLQELQQMRGVMAVAANELVEMNSAPKLAAQRDAAIKSLR